MPDRRSGRDSGIDGIVTVAEPGPDGLIDVNHVRVVVPGVWVQVGFIGGCIDVAGSVFLEKPDQAGAACEVANSASLQVTVVT